MSDTVPCKICDGPTMMKGTKLCDPCWNMHNAMTSNPDRATLVQRYLDTPVWGLEGSSGSCPFQARITMYGGLLQEVDIMTWELEPIEDNLRPGREWVKEHIQDLDLQWFVNHFGKAARAVAFELVFTGVLCGSFSRGGDWDDWDEYIEVQGPHLIQELPEEWFE